MNFSVNLSCISFWVLFVFLWRLPQCVTQHLLDVHRWSLTFLNFICFIFFISTDRFGCLLPNLACFSQVLDLMLFPFTFAALLSLWKPHFLFDHYSSWADTWWYCRLDYIIKVPEKMPDCSWVWVGDSLVYLCLLFFFLQCMISRAFCYSWKQNCEYIFY